MKKIVAILFFCVSLFLYFPVSAEDNAAQNEDKFERENIIIIEKNGELYVEDTTVEELEGLFYAVKYDDYIFMPNMLYPAIFLKKIPRDFDKIEDESYRNRLFIQMLAPVAMKVAEDLFAEREKMLEMRKIFDEEKTLSEEQKKQLEDWAVQYDIFTHLKGDFRIEYIFDELKKKLDVIPPSILIGVAAIESNWGTSRPAREANSLYKEKVWFGEEKGLAPQLEEGKNDDYEFKIFDSIYDAMRSYSISMSSGVDYYYMRAYRSEYRRRNRLISGRTLAHSMMLSSQLKNFAGLLDYTITFYEMQNLDLAKLLRMPKNEE